MGEYAMFRGERIKIGTCEDMYYLRADQARLIVPQSGNVNPKGRTDQQTIRFRFPWPDEDHIEPGMFDDFDKSIAVPDRSITAPADLEHHSVQFTSSKGYVTSLPCPESPAGKLGPVIHRNGFAGPVHVVQQAYRGGNLAVICQCGGCGARYNLPTLQDAEPIIVAFRSEADKHPTDARSRYWHVIADRIAAGYQVPA